MKEKFDNKILTGSINIRLPELNKVWVADKATLVNQIKEIVRIYQAEGDVLTLRQLYYQLVSRDWIPNHDKVYGKLSSIKDDICYSGQVDWNAFEDRGRRPHIAYYEDSVAGALQRTLDYYNLDLQQNQPTHIEVWTEKDAISGVLKSVCDEYVVRMVVNKGYSSSTAMYGAYERFVKYLNQGKKVVVLYFGDHDPSGLDMVRDIKDRISHMLISGIRLDYKAVNEWVETGEFQDFYDEHCYDRGYYKPHPEFEDEPEIFDLVRGYVETHYEVRQIGLTKSQIRQYAPPPNPAKITDPRAKGYIKEHGNVSWEVDALSPKIMRDIVRSSILDIMDTTLFEQAIEKLATDKEQLESLIEDTRS